MIKVKNIGSSTVYLICADLKFHRKLAPGREIPVAAEVFDELTFDNGFQNLIQAGCVRVSGLEAEQAEELKPVMKALSRDELKVIFNDKNYTAFAKVLADATPATKESAANLAVEMRIADPGFTMLIKKYCGVDVVEAISRKEQEMEG